ncbi:MAG: DUF4038 domain-containing protein [Marinilabiliales bacterium]|nr:MAG: DUF4038 domain-containing protein [Marinilabiliales bacterium]
MLRSSFFVLSFVLYSVSSLAGDHSCKVWEVIELSFTATESIDNPYGQIPVDGSADHLEVAFRGISGPAEGKVMTLKGFWYEGNAWRVRFAPPVPGVWEYMSYSADEGMDGVTGTIDVRERTALELEENPAGRGFIRVNDKGPRSGRYFEYADGTPFLWIGDTWWNWAKRNIPFSRFKELADDRANKGFTMGQLFVPGNGWGGIATIHEDNFTRIDTDHIKKIDSIVSYANQVGITVWIHAWWTREGMAENIGEEKIMRWWRYLIHRYGAYNVVWVVSGEYNLYNYGGFPLDFWEDVGRMIKEEDPYERAVSTHPTPPGWEGGADAPQWSTAEVLHHADWLDYNQSQTGHGRYRNELTPEIVADSYRRYPPKPVVVTEPWYEFVEGNPRAMDIRLGAWSAFLSGAAGHSYAGGHVWKAHVPESRMGPDAWPMDLGFETNTMDYPGAVSMGVMSRFLQGTEWWRFEPAPGLVSDYPDRYASHIPGEKILAYLRYGGGAKIDLSLFPEGTPLRLTWLDPSNGETRSRTMASPGSTHFISSPTSYPGTLEYRDWVMLLEKADSNAHAGQRQPE